MMNKVTFTFILFIVSCQNNPVVVLCWKAWPNLEGLGKKKRLYLNKKQTLLLLMLAAFIHSDFCTWIQIFKYFITLGLSVLFFSLFQQGSGSSEEVLHSTVMLTQSVCLNKTHQTKFICTDRNDGWRDDSVCKNLMHPVCVNTTFHSDVYLISSSALLHQ